MQKIVYDSLFDLLKIQGTISFLAIYFAGPILINLNITDTISINIFRFSVIGAFFHAYIMIIIIILLYYDLRKEILFLTSLFAFTNILFTYFSKQLGSSYYGIGYASSCLITFLISLFLLKRCFDMLEYRTFTNQPIIGMRKDSPKLKARPNGGYGEYIDLDDVRAKMINKNENT